VPDSGSPGNQVDKVIAASGSALAGAKLIACWSIGAYDGITRSVFKTALTKSQVAEVLSLNLGGASSTTFQGEVTENDFQISVVHQGIRNACWPILCGRIDKESEACRVTTYVDIAPSSKVFITKLLCVPVVIGSVLLMCFDWNPVTVLAFCFPLFGILFVRLGKFIGKADEKKLLGLMESIDSKSKPLINLPKSTE
jgi:hypothetical protein